MLTHDKTVTLNGVLEKLLLLSIGASWWGPPIFIFTSLGLLFACIVTGVMLLRRIPT